MFKNVFIILGFLVCNSLSAELIKPDIPINISTVKTQLVNKKLVRTIEYNMTKEPKIIIEMLTRPRQKVISRLEIKSVKYKGRALDFLESAGTSFESIKVKDNKLVIEIFYVYPGKGGGSVDLVCTVNVTNEISTPACSEK